MKKKSKGERLGWQKATYERGKFKWDDSGNAFFIKDQKGQIILRSIFSNSNENNLVEYTLSIDKSTPEIVKEVYDIRNGRGFFVERNRRIYFYSSSFYKKIELNLVKRTKEELEQLRRKQYKYLIP